MHIVIDFDGTCVAHDFPRIGKDIGAVPVLKAIIGKGHKLVLSTMRSNNQKVALEGCDPVITKTHGPWLDEAVKWFADNEIPLYGIQTNPTQKHWTTSPKAFGQLMIDDAALGCPLVYPDASPDGSHTDERPYIDWVAVEKLLTIQGIL